MSQKPRLPHLEPEKVAYWYFRLNGFFQIENFVVHPGRKGSQRTDVDILGVRFPFRVERLFDDPHTIMQDDNVRLSLPDNQIDIIIAEVKANQPCTLNGPWTREQDQNMHRILAAIGCMQHANIEAAAADIYQSGIHTSETGLRVRLVAVGASRNDDLETKFSQVTQLIWTEMLAFIWNRFHTFDRQKTQVDQWDAQGLLLKRLVKESEGLERFVADALSRMGVRNTKR